MNNLSAQEAVPALIGKADQLFRAGQSAAAVELLTRGIRLAPNALDLYCMLTEILLEVEQYQAALEVIDELPTEISALRKTELRCSCLEGLQRYEEAEEIIDTFLSVEAPAASLLNLKGVLLYHRQEIQRAQKYFERCIQFDAAFGRAYVNLGLMKLSQGEAKTGLELLEKGFVFESQNNHAIDTYYELISEICAYDRAEPLFRDACRRYPGNKKLAYLLIDILLRQNKLRTALDHIQTAIATFGIEDGILEPALKIQNSLKLSNCVATSGGISLCMIVKDEEKRLARCLESVKGVVNEIVIVDTGSLDRTGEIARIFGSRVYACEWQGDFSLARNLSLSNANGDWIFILDADEVVADRDHDELRKIARDSDAGPAAYSFLTRNYTDDAGTEGWRINDNEYPSEQAGDGWNPSEKVRMFPNDERIRFENAVHELVEPSLRRIGIPLKKCPIPIHHYGLLNQRQTIQKKDRYYALGKNKLAGKKRDLAALMECAIQAAEVGEYIEAVSLWKKILKQQPDLPKAYFNLSFVYIQLEQYGDGLKAARKAIAFDPGLKEAVLNCALCLLRLGDIQAAIGHLEQFLTGSPDHPIATGLLAVAHCILGNGERGIELLGAVKKQGFDCSEYILDHGRKLASAGKVRTAIALIECVSKSAYGNREIRSMLAELTRPKSTLRF
jgi:tetratricopeptide (TPR) repeat protein